MYDQFKLVNRIITTTQKIIIIRCPHCHCRFFNSSSLKLLFTTNGTTVTTAVYPSFNLSLSSSENIQVKAASDASFHFFLSLPFSPLLLLIYLTLSWTSSLRTHLLALNAFPVVRQAAFWKTSADLFSLFKLTPLPCILSCVVFDNLIKQHLQDTNLCLQSLFYLF